MSLPPEWEPWSRTILRFGTGELEVDLAEAVADDTVQAMRALGLQGPFAVVTPCNPQGVLLDADTNARRLAAAARMLAEQGLCGVPAAGRSPDGGHWEPGWALAVPKEEARLLAGDWEQAGLYWWDDSQFWIVSVKSVAEPTAHPWTTGS
ncbi:MAG: DUF3293 domain-containing protein [Gemmatimonadota bacterium]|nr:DUF3293 domain-containing protein [Gemmatimonadota bacterium]